MFYQNTKSSTMTKLCLIVCILSLTFICVNSSREKVEKKQAILESKETNAPNFARLVVMRLIYGVFRVFGWEENLSGFLNGVFVPPGADDDSDYGDLSDLFS